MASVHIGPVREKKTNHLYVARPCCVMQRRASERVPSVDGDTLGEKGLNIVQFAGPHGGMERFRH
jgi:hypothetical protein